jgi:hypothetical protein
MPGYSGTPLPKKLGIKPGFRVALDAVPPEVRAELGGALAECEFSPGLKQPVDFLMVFTKSKQDLSEGFEHRSKRLTPAGMFWVAWPKKSSGVATDLNEDIVREIGLAAGLVDVKVCAVTEVWSGLKFVRRLKDR